MAEGTVDEPALAALADGLRQHDLDVGWGVETILRSRRFFAAEISAAKIIGPAEYVVGSVRALELFAAGQHPAHGRLDGRMGQDLFYPPNVGGWPEGRTWLASGAIVARANFAAALVEGRLTQSAGAAGLRGPRRPPCRPRQTARRNRVACRIAVRRACQTNNRRRPSPGHLVRPAPTRPLVRGGAYAARPARRPLGMTPTMHLMGFLPARQLPHKQRIRPAASESLGSRV